MKTPDQIAAEAAEKIDGFVRSYFDGEDQPQDVPAIIKAAIEEAVAIAVSNLEYMRGAEPAQASDTGEKWKEGRPCPCCGATGIGYAAQASERCEDKPATGEWTAQRIIQFLGLHSKHTEAASFLADAINAAIEEALSAEREQSRTSASNAAIVIGDLRKQLAAERERPCAWCESERDEVLQQLAAERDIAKGIQEGWAEKYEQLREQLDAEREQRNKELQDEIKRRQQSSLPE